MKKINLNSILKKTFEKKKKTVQKEKIRQKIARNTKMKKINLKNILKKTFNKKTKKVVGKKLKVKKNKVSKVKKIKKIKNNDLHSKR